jgi:pimeloyl-ACP methyl ester carboxylesterase
MQNYVDAVKELLTKLNIKKIDIVCHSFGGRVALMLTQSTEQKTFEIENLVLVAPAGIKKTFSLKRFFKIRKYKLLKFMYKTFGDNNQKNNSNKSFKQKKFLINLKQKIENAGSIEYKSLSPIMKQTFINIVNKKLNYTLKNINAKKVLIIGGKTDDAVPLSSIKKIYNGISKNKFFKNKSNKLIYLNIFKTGHFCYLEESEKFNNLINHFLSL